MDDASRAAVIVPFLGVPEALAPTLEAVLAHLPRGARLVVVDDGCVAPVSASTTLAFATGDPRLALLRHPQRRGPGAARNTAIGWCRQNGIDLVILLDADCIPPPDFVAQHLARHREHPDVVCIGGAIEGQGTGLWARLDGLLSWFTSMPHSASREVTGAMHIPTTNMSLKLTARLPSGPFDERLRTGEDVVFVRELQRAEDPLLFCPTPVIMHRDRCRLADMLAHQLQWGRHTYFVRFGGPRDSLLRRAAFALLFGLATPLYASVATWLTLRPWLPRHPRDWPLLPLVWVMYVLKGMAAIDGALRPHRALFDMARV